VRVKQEILPHSIPISPLQNLLLQAANLSLGWYNRGDFKVTAKSDDSPVTQADLDVHQVLHQGLLELYPDIPFLSEEAEIPPHQERKNWKAFWICDPIDGTKEFVSHTDEWTINLALILRDSSGNYQVQAGWVLAPALGLFFQGICPPAFELLGMTESKSSTKASASRAQIVSDHSSEQTSPRHDQSEKAGLTNWELLEVDSEKRAMLIQRLSQLQKTPESGADFADQHGNGADLADPHGNGVNFASPSEVGADFALRTSRTPGPHRTNDAKFRQQSEGAAPANPTIKIPASRNHRQPELEQLLQKLAPFETITVGSSLKFCRVAEGFADYYPRPVQLNEWDIAAAHGVLKAAGGNVYVIHREGDTLVRSGSAKEASYNSSELRAPMFEAF